MLSESVTVVLDFIGKINAGDVAGIKAALTPDNRFVDMQGEVAEGRERIAAGWKAYLEANPDHRIYIRRIFETPEGVALAGHTTGSHLHLPDEEEFHKQGMLWLAEVTGGKIASWQFFPDILENYGRLGLTEDTEVFAPAWMAATIAKHLDLLPAGSMTDDVRNVRKYYSRLYRHAPPEIITATAEHLFFDEGYRFVPYELLYHHPGAIRSLSPEQVEQLGQGINDWSSTDTYAHYLAGPAWKQGVISTEMTDKWLRSEVVWWRRAAVVSTIFLGGDVEQMLAYAEALVDDKEDTIIKALSWVLRSAIRYDREAVEAFLATHKSQLAARIKREVRNKLRTGLKNP